MNIIYYLTGSINKTKTHSVTGGHGYSYDTSIEGKKKIVKDVPTVYGYFVNNPKQNISVNIVNYLHGRVYKGINIEESFLLHLEMLFNYYKENDIKKLLIVTGLPKTVNKFLAKKLTNTDLGKELTEFYQANKDNIILDQDLYPCGGIGIRQSYNQTNIAMMLVSDVPEFEGDSELEIISEKEYKNPNIDIDKIITATRWFFNTGDLSDFYTLTENGRRAYRFGRIDPDKNYYGKATPDVYYSVYYSKEPIAVLDKLYDYCLKTKPNPYNLLFAGNLNHLTSKEIARVINDVPGVFKGNELITPLKIANNDEPAIVEMINPPGLSYRIVNCFEGFDGIYKAFLNRDDENKFKNTEFLDITDLVFIRDEKGKLKINPEFDNNTLKLQVKIPSPHCKNMVRINLSVKYDIPSRNAFNSIIVNKLNDVKIWLCLNFNNPTGVIYYTLTQTEKYDYLHANSIANIHYYSVREIGKQ